MFSGILKGFISSLYIALSTNFLNIGSAVFEPVSNLPRDFGVSYPIYTPIAKSDVKPINQASRY